MRADLRCPKCETRMVEGFVIDHGYGFATETMWQEGPPKRSIWTGLKLDKKAQLPVTTWRCTGCGYLESYATGKTR